MTEPTQRTDDPGPADTDEAAEIVRDDPALSVATDDTRDDETAGDDEG
jgi:hypothetical protein